MAALTDLLSSTQTAVDGLDRASARFGQTLLDAFVKAGVQGKNFETVLQSVGEKLLALAAKDLVPNLNQSVSSTVASLSDNITAFASGGIISTPTYVASGAGPTALMGEAGPEAILPLARGADGQLGLKGGRPTVVNVSIMANDLESFKRSEQQVAQALARAVARGRRSL